jgi:hypothetical protein
MDILEILDRWELVLLVRLDHKDLWDQEVKLDRRVTPALKVPQDSKGRWAERDRAAPKAILVTRGPLPTLEPRVFREPRDLRVPLVNRVSRASKVSEDFKV